jgi:predicted CXXCH cytochrome family protein
MPRLKFSRVLLKVLVVACFGLMGAVLAEAGAPAQEGEQPQPPESCATCHIDVVASWQDSLHARAYSDPVFQEYWQAGGSDTECLACHTTGFVTRTGEYAYEGVVCEACHGETPADHPAEPVAIDPGVATCADCHPTTFSEWEQSAHGEQQLACTTCHNPHPQTLRFETEDALCLNCHDEDARDDYVHLTHTEQQCVNCHWHHADPETSLAHYSSGSMFPTGHAAFVETRACVACHEERSEDIAVAEGETAREEMNLTSDHPLLEAQVRIKELEAEVDTKDAQGANTSALRLMQGLVLGVALGGVVVFGVTRVRQRGLHVVRTREEE